MWREIAAFIVSFIAMILTASSYFVKEKSFYLALQALGIAGLGVSYFFTEEYFAAAGMAIGLGRTLTYYLYERKNEEAPLAFAFLFFLLSTAAYLTVNLGILRTAKLYDLLYLATLAGYAFVFRLRDLKFVRYALLPVLALSILYNLIANSTVFVVLSYSFELGASVVAIFKYRLLNRRITNAKQNR